MLMLEMFLFCCSICLLQIFFYKVMKVNIFFFLKIKTGEGILLNFIMCFYWVFNKNGGDFFFFFYMFYLLHVFMYLDNMYVNSNYIKDGGVVVNSDCNSKFQNKKVFIINIMRLYIYMNSSMKFQFISYYRMIIFKMFYMVFSYVDLKSKMNCMMSLLMFMNEMWCKCVTDVWDEMNNFLFLFYFGQYKVIVVYLSLN